MQKLSNIDITISGLKQHYGNGDFSPKQLIDLLLKECDKHADNPIWIYRLSRQEINVYLQNLENKKCDNLPLFGIPFAIKDNIDLAGVPTTAACEAFAYTPKKSAYVVEQLLQAGAIPIGKTNLDQFATGLVGTRSPWGACQNSFNKQYISGGSSSGSAVAVATGLVSFALGTDTAGSGRVPASLNNIVGLKPTRGLLSTSGVVPACRSLDCVSIFALNSDDANHVFDIAAAFDREDSYARPNTYANSKRYYGNTLPSLKIGVASDRQLEFFGDQETSKLFQQALAAVKDVGAECIEIDLTPFIEAAKLLYSGPWVSERYLATQPILDANSEAMLPVIREIISVGARGSAADAFAAHYLLQKFQQQAIEQLQKVDAIVTPTIGTPYKIEEVQRDPIRLNSNLGYYTNFMNLLDCAAITVPTGFYQNEVAFGITLFHQKFSDKRLLSIAQTLQRKLNLPMGATGKHYQYWQLNEKKFPYQAVNVVVCGAHLNGLPLNWQLTERGATLKERTQTTDKYRLYALAGGPPLRPGLQRVENGGTAIDVEVWSLPVENFGSFVAEIPAPLGIGKVELRDGSWQPGFICEGYGLDTAIDITRFGSWLNYINSLPRD